MKWGRGAIGAADDRGFEREEELRYVDGCVQQMMWS